MTRKAHRRGTAQKDEYTVLHVARCTACGELTQFRRHPDDCHVGKKNHRKHLHCYSCGKDTLHIQLGEAIETTMKQCVAVGTTIRHAPLEACPRNWQAGDRVRVTMDLVRRRETWNGKVVRMTTMFDEPYAEVRFDNGMSRTLPVRRLAAA